MRNPLPQVEKQDVLAGGTAANACNEVFGGRGPVIPIPLAFRTDAESYGPAPTDGTLAVHTAIGISTLGTYGSAGR